MAVKGTAIGPDGQLFGFVLYAYDSSTDRFRLVVWPQSAGAIPGGEITYDNRRGAATTST